MLHKITLASHDARTAALAEKLENMANGKYMPFDIWEWRQINKAIDSTLVQADRVKLINLYNIAVEKANDMFAFNPKYAEPVKAQ